MRKLIVLIVLVILTGCGFEELLPDKEPEPPQVIEKEVIKEKIVYIDRNITIPCNVTNVTCPEFSEYNYTSSTSRETELIRRIRFLEGQTDKYWNFTECDWELNQSDKSLKKCREELCEFNSSWC